MGHPLILDSADSQPLPDTKVLVVTTVKARTVKSGAECLTLSPTPVSHHRPCWEGPSGATSPCTQGETEALQVGNSSRSCENW